MYPLREVLLLVTCATIASCDDFDDIVAWGKHHLDVLRRFSEFHYGIPCERWVRKLVNRVDPILFARCFDSWVAALWPDRHDLIAIDGKTARRTHDRRKGLKALHTLSAYATSAQLTLAQLSVPEKTNEITAIPDLLDHLAETKQLQGALVTIDAIGCQVDIADKIVAHKADYLLALKRRACAPMSACACSPITSNGTCANASPQCSMTTPIRRLPRTCEPPSSPRRSAHPPPSPSKPAAPLRTLFPVHSFQSLLADLATLAQNTVTTAIDASHEFILHTRPTVIQKKALDLLGIKPATCAQ